MRTVHAGPAFRSAEMSDPAIERGAARARIPYFDNFNVVDLFILKKLVQYRAMESGMIHLPSTVLCTDRCQSQP